MLKIVLPVYNNLHLTQMCVESIVCGSYVPYELIIVDDCSTDNTEKWCLDFIENSKTDKDEHLVNIIYHRNTENKGVTYSWNKGIELAGKENLICIMNNDVIVEPMWDANLILTMDTGKSVVSPYHINTLNDRDLFEKGIPQFESCDGRWHDNGGFPILGACFMCRPNLFNDIGLLPEEIKFWANDNFLVDKCAKNGYEMAFEPSSHVMHLYSQSIRFVPAHLLNADVEYYNSKIKPTI